MTGLRTAGIPWLGMSEEAHSLRNSNPNSAVSLGAAFGHFVAVGLGQTSVPCRNRSAAVSIRFHSLHAEGTVSQEKECINAAC